VNRNEEIFKSNCGIAGGRISYRHTGNGGGGILVQKPV
jgi:hypothetical protein